MKNLSYLLLVIFLFSACKENDSEAILKIRLTDAPADYDEVLIDVQGIMVHSSAVEEDDGWVILENVNTGVFNLLDFTNGMDTVLVEQPLPSGTISQMRLLLGENNSLKKDGVYYDLKTPSAQSSGLKFNIHAELIEGITYSLWIDFDAARSIVEKGNGTYSLKPVIRTYTEATSGAIQGVVSPVEAKPYVMAISESSDTSGTYADTLTGDFLISGLDEGNYNLEFHPVDSFVITELVDVNVVIGEVTLVDTVNIPEE